MPGPEVASVSLAITGIEIGREGFKPRNVLPVSAVLFPAKKVTDLDTKRLALMVEATVPDSISRENLAEGVYTITGANFRPLSDTDEVLSDLAIEWAVTAVSQASAKAGNSSATQRKIIYAAGMKITVS